MSNEQQQTDRAGQGSRAAQKTPKGEQAKRAILAATKELVARKGPHATSVRDVTEASGANVAAVTYYFGSKDALIAGAIDDITGAVNARRLARLDMTLTASQGAALAGEAILRALIEPIGEVSRAEDGGSLYLRMLYHMRIQPQDPLAQASFARNDHVAQRFISEMARTFPHLTRDDLIWRYEFARGAAVHLLSDMDPLVRRIELLGAREDGAELSDRVFDRVIGLIIGGFAPADRVPSRF